MIELFIVGFVLMSACGSSSGGGAGNANNQVIVDLKSDSYVEDTDQNDNLTLQEVSCAFEKGFPSIQQFFTSKYLGQGYFVEISYDLPNIEEWDVNNTFTYKESSNCGYVVSYRAIKASTLPDAKGGIVNDMMFMYGCGGKCTFKLNSRTLNAENKFTALDVEWECTGVALMPISANGSFGSSIDKFVGKAICE